MAGGARNDDRRHRALRAPRPAGGDLPDTVRGLRRAYETRWFDGAADLDAATDVPLSASSPSTGIDAVLRSSEAPNDIPGAAIPASPFWGWVGQDDRNDVYAVASDDGQAIQVTLSGEDGTDFDPTCTRRAPRASRPARSRRRRARTIRRPSTTLRHRAARTTSTFAPYSGDGDYSVNYSVVDYGAISGAATDAQGPLQNATVTAWRIAGNGSYVQMASVATDSTGSYMLTRLPAGDYVVGFSATLHLTTYFANSSKMWDATTVRVTENQVKSGVDQNLQPAGRIDGRLADGIGLGVANVSVYAYRVTQPYGYLSYETSTSSVIDGLYSLDGLPAGKYKLYFQDYVGSYAWTLVPGRRVLLARGPCHGDRRSGRRRRRRDAASRRYDLRYGDRPHHGRSRVWASRLTCTRTRTGGSTADTRTPVARTRSSICLPAGTPSPTPSTVSTSAVGIPARRAAPSPST